jgi:acetyl-CoA carboxylase biotin carboxyl carrier protein
VNEAASAKMQQENDKEKNVAENLKQKDEKGDRPKEKAGAPSLNMNELRELADLIDEYSLVDFEFENANIRVHMRKQMPHMAQPAQQHPMQVATAPPAAPQPETPHPGTKTETEAAADEGLHKIISPIVGTFYKSPSPDAAFFVQVGDKVTPDTVVCIIEAMKLMNEIQAEVSGEVVKVYVENGQPVEYGQPLFAVK